MVTWVPIAPLVGLMDVICGVGTLKKTLPALLTPATVTITAPEIAKDGTFAVI